MHTTSPLHASARGSRHRPACAVSRHPRDAAHLSLRTLACWNAHKHPLCLILNAPRAAARPPPTSTTATSGTRRRPSRRTRRARHAAAERVVRAVGGDGLLGRQRRHRCGGRPGPHCSHARRTRGAREREGKSGGGSGETERRGDRRASRRPPAAAAGLPTAPRGQPGGGEGGSAARRSRARALWHFCHRAHAVKKKKNL